MKKSVGLIIYVFFNDVLHAILQKRGEFNVEKMKSETWPGACQVSVHGGLQNEENFEQALLREANEEMPGLIIDFSRLDELCHETSETKDTITYGFVSEKNLDELLLSFNLHSCTGGLKIITADNLSSIQTLNDNDKSGIIDGSIKMFSDEIRALKEGFYRFSM
ncbi:MAG: NUDIX domain-containing protein [Patescibacteria group bacterium]|nr:NUDIX domain-containing protein [Patescibacteria group bacterium]